MGLFNQSFGLVAKANEVAEDETTPGLTSRAMERTRIFIQIIV